MKIRKQRYHRNKLANEAKAIQEEREEFTKATTQLKLLRLGLKDIHEVSVILIEQFYPRETIEEAIKIGAETKIKSQENRAKAAAKWGEDYMSKTSNSVWGRAMAAKNTE